MQKSAILRDQKGYLLVFLGIFYNVTIIFLQTSLQLGSRLLKGLGVMSDDVTFLSQLVRDSMELQAQALIVTKDPDPDVMTPMQVLSFFEQNDHFTLLSRSDVE